MIVALVTVALILLSAFFVAVEFSLMAVRRHRLQEAAATSRMARAALRSSSELTLILAGAQLGITVCTLALGAITKPAVHHALTPVLANLGMPAVAADVASFVLALFIVTFLHLVIGEMAPKSWAIAHPERSAVLLAVPMRGFMVLTRPVLKALNSAANWLVRRTGIEPVDELSAGQDPDGLRQLVEHSANVGALAAGYRASVAGALDLRQDTVESLFRPGRRVTAVPADATIAQVQAATLESGHLRVLLTDADRVTGVVHVRDTLLLDDLDSPALPLARTPFEVPGGLTLHEALATMMRTSNHLAVVRTGRAPLAVITLADILAKLFPGETTQAVDEQGTVTPPGQR